MERSLTVLSTWKRFLVIKMKYNYLFVHHLPEKILIANGNRRECYRLFVFQSCVGDYRSLIVINQTANELVKETCRSTQHEQKP